MDKAEPVDFTAGDTIQVEDLGLREELRILLDEMRERGIDADLELVAEIATRHPEWERQAEWRAVFLDSDTARRAATAKVQVEARRAAAKSIKWSRATEGAERFEEWTVYELLPRAGMAAVFGASGDGKSALVVDLVAHIALGQPWFGRNIDTQAMVAYFAAENPVSIKRRFNAWAIANRIKPELLDDRISIGTGVLDLNDRASVGRFKGAARELVAQHPGQLFVWVIDTLSASMSGEENSKQLQDAARAALEAAQEVMGAAALVLFVHHTGKDVEREERGHSSLRAILDTSLRVEAGEAASERPTEAHPRVTVKSGLVTVRKQRDGVEGAQMPFLLDAIYTGTDAKGRARSQVVCAMGGDADEAARSVAAKKANGTTKAPTDARTLSRVFDEEDHGQGVPYATLLDLLADRTRKSPDTLRANFTRLLKQAGLESVGGSRGHPAVVRRTTTCTNGWEGAPSRDLADHQYKRSSWKARQ